MSRQGSEGRSESLSYKLMIYLILVAGGLPVVLPFYWMVLASLKTKERVDAHPPDWLPVVPKDFVTVDGQELRVKIFDEGEVAGTMVKRLKVLHEDAPLLTLPAGRIEAGEQRLYFANVDGRRQRVRRAGPAQGGRLRAAFLGEPRSVVVPGDAIERELARQTYWSVLGADLSVRLAEADLPDAGAAVVTEILPPAPADDGMVLADPRVIDVSPDVLEKTDDGWVVRYAGRRLPASVLGQNQAAGYVAIQLQVPPDGLSVPVSELRQAEREAAYAQIDGYRRAVKPLRPAADGAGWVVELPDEYVEREIAAEDLEVVTKDVYYAELLGQRVRVDPVAGALPAEAAASVDVAIAGVLTVTAEKIRHEAPLRPQWINFALAWKEQKFDLYLANTLLIAALVVLGTTMSCGLVGYAFARLRFRGSNVLFLILLSTMMIPPAVTSVPTFVMYATFGWIDTYLPLIVPHFLAHAAFFVFLYRQFMMTIPVDLEDSARIDGCGPLATWWLIMMPLSKPIIVTVAVFSFIGAWNDFLAPLLYINSDQKQTIALGLQNFKSAFQYVDPQLMMAASVMMLIPTVVLFFFAQKAFMQGVVVSGVKG